MTTALAKQLEARLVPLGGDRFAAVRLVGHEIDGSFVIDIWDRGKSTLKEELCRRDLTINSIAVDLGDGSWHDPVGGRRDIDARVLRATTKDSFRHDPLRVLRLTRLAAELPDFSVDKRARDLAARQVAALAEIAAERRREEFGRTMNAARPERAVNLWAAIGLSLMAGGDRTDTEIARVFEDAMARGRSHRPFLGETEQAAPPHLSLFALNAAVLSVAAEADPQALLDSGYIIRREAREIALVMAHRRLPTRIADQRWLLHRSADQWPAAICHAATWESEMPPEEIGPLVSRIAALARSAGDAIFNPEPLLRGDVIRRLLGLAAGPEVGVVAKRLRRLQIEGRLRDHREAVDWLLSEHR
jgi:tRNA nucleotidyltransferase/poly(A) polymerase